MILKFSGHMSRQNSNCQNQMEKKMSMISKAGSMTTRPDTSLSISNNNPSTSQYLQQKLSEIQKSQQEHEIEYENSFISKQQINYNLELTQEQLQQKAKKKVMQQRINSYIKEGIDSGRIIRMQEKEYKEYLLQYWGKRQGIGQNNSEKKVFWDSKLMTKQDLINIYEIQEKKMLSQEYLQQLKAWEIEFFENCMNYIKGNKNSIQRIKTERKTYLNTFRGSRKNLLQDDQEQQYEEEQKKPKSMQNIPISPMHSPTKKKRKSNRRVTFKSNSCQKVTDVDHHTVATTAPTTNNLINVTPTTSINHGNNSIEIHFQKDDLTHKILDFSNNATKSQYNAIDDIQSSMDLLHSNIYDENIKKIGSGVQLPYSFQNKIRKN